MQVWSAVLVLLSIVATVHCFSTGAPAAACADIYPVGHSGTSQDLSTNPFQLSLSDFDETYGGEFYYVPGQQYTLTLSGSGGEEFRGFLVQARTVADGSPVGVFTDNDNDQALSSCTPAESAVTHTSNDPKSSVTLSWTAPPDGTGEIIFLYAIVVQNSNGISTFYAPSETEVIHPCGLPLYESSGRCVETCPNGEFGNGNEASLTGVCQQLPADYSIALNATIYYAEISTDTPLNTPVYRIRISINVTLEPIDISVRFFQTGQINNLFEFEGNTAKNRRDISTNELQTIGNERVFGTSINLVADPASEFGEDDYPVELDITIQFVVFTQDFMDIQYIAEGLGSIQQAPDPCDNEPCQNGASCQHINSEEFTCSCLPGFTGAMCEQVTDPCIAYQPCDNQATCLTISSSEYSCDCQPGYTGQNCSNISDLCLVQDPCVNGTCNPEGSLGYTCECITGYTGVNCSINIDDCLQNDCVHGVCIDGIASYDCGCDPGYTGSQCNIDIDECETVDCNNGSCRDLVNDYMCNCYQDYTGQHCDEIINDCAFFPCNLLSTLLCEDGNSTYTCHCAAGFTGQNCSEEVPGCSSDPCQNGATCMNRPGGEFSCLCPPEWTGNTCSEDPLPCDPNPCTNGGNCSQSGSSFFCDCTMGWTGLYCDQDLDECSSNPCDNGGSCRNFNGSFECECPNGFSGSNCGEDLDFCQMLVDKCRNGVCVEGYGTETSCNCTRGYTGDSCDEDDPSELFCEDDSCANGGTCIEEYGTQTNCTCVRGFMGESCEEDDPTETFCDDRTCENEGVCEEDFGNSTTCICVHGYTGPTCAIDLSFCLSDTCMNGGSCMEGNGSDITCYCANGFTGMLCEMDIDTYCESRECFNGGTCIEGYGDETSCNCSRGFIGESCTEDDPNEIFCDDNNIMCQNGGTCIEGFGSDTSCDCTRGFTGEYCDEDDPSELFCEDDSCANGGTCIEDYGPETNCTCVRGFLGESCEEDDPTETFCDDRICENEGVCEEDFGNSTTCICVHGYTGPTCTIDLSFCLSDTCMNGGSCMEGNGSDITCYCANGFTGMLCEMDIDTYCESRECFNGGTCIEGYGDETSCNCSRGFIGESCTEDDPNEIFCNVNTNTCQNGGTCIEGFGSDTSCNCTRGFTGEYCDEDDLSELFCEDNFCVNGGTCNEEYGPETSCSCIRGYTGDSCAEDDPNELFCEEANNFCENGGTCNEEYGPATNCTCVRGFTGNFCHDDDPNELFCNGDCANGGTCIEGYGTETSCVCVRGYTGDSCTDDDENEEFCEEDHNLCRNGGTCNEEFGPETSCACPLGYTGRLCENDDPNVIFCQSNTCQNGGTCNEGFGPSTTCICLPTFTGSDCNETIDSGICIYNSCSSGTYCNISCASDSYDPHVALLSTTVTFTGESFVRVSNNLHPDFSTSSLSIFAYFRQDRGNQGYLFFYGTSENSRNLAVFLDGKENLIWLFYTTTTGDTMNGRMSANISDGNYHSLAIAISVEAQVAIFYVDGKALGDSNSLSLRNADIVYGITTNNPVLYVGARLPRHFKFSGDIVNVIVFPDKLFSEAEVQVHHEDIADFISPTGVCVEYLQLGDKCPKPMQPPSLLCMSIYDLCDPNLRCLPEMDGKYTCQPKPLECTSDGDCSSGYFCGSPLPLYGSNYYDHPREIVSGDAIFLQKNTMELDGLTVIPLSNALHPQLSSDLSIFATVCQEAGNDGYILGKGVNDRVRDFGLYLRSTKQTVWLAYGYNDEDDERFREILFFTDVLVADGNCHSVAAVIESSSNRAVLYIDGNAIGSKTLPSTPEFNPEFNTLYVGGRPSTRLFRFKGSIGNLFVTTVPISGDVIAALHQQAFDGGDIGTISLTNTVRYCYAYQSSFEDCYMDTFVDNNFRCQPPEQCVPVFDQSNTITLPVVGSDDPLLIRGKCIAPCETSCGSEPMNLQCGRSGLTYYNSCYRECANELRIADDVGECPSYYNLYTS